MPAARTTMTLKEKQFLYSLIGFSCVASEWVSQKLDFKGIKSTGLPASIIAGDILYRSDFGNHPISQPKLGGRFSNNLALLETGPYWTGKSNIHEGKHYRLYKDWVSFMTNYTDDLVFSGEYDEVFQANTHKSKLKNFSLTKPDSRVYYNEVTNLVTQYNLLEMCNENGKTG